MFFFFLVVCFELKFWRTWAYNYAHLMLNAYQTRATLSRCLYARLNGFPTIGTIVCVRISEVNYFTYDVDNECLSFCHFNKSTDEDWFLLYLNLSFEQSNVRNGRIKLNLLNETLPDSLTVYTLFSSHTIIWNGAIYEKNFFIFWRKMKTFSYFHLLRKKISRKIAWDYVWLCLFRSYRTFDLILDRQHFQW